MFNHALISFTCIAVFAVKSNGDWNFPEETQSFGIKKTNPNEDLSQYEKYIDDIISSGISNLTLSINKVLCNDFKKNGENIVFSPLSIAGAMALVLLGATGSTEAEIAHVLGLISKANIQDNTLTFHEHLGNLFTKLQTTSDSPIRLNFATGIFVQEDFPIRHAYKRISETLYKSDVLNFDFKRKPMKARDAINAWISEKTNSKIKNILDEVPPNTKLVIANALYFKGGWEFPFIEKGTTRQPFYVNGRKNPEHVMVDLMANGGLFPYYRNERLNCEILGFPYKGNSKTMYVIMPLNSNVQTLKTLENSLTPSEIQKMVERTRYTEATILFPKMHLETTLDLRSTFSSLGVTSLFNPARSNLALIADEDLPYPTFIDDKRGKSTQQPEDYPLIFSRFKSPENSTRTTKRQTERYERHNLRSPETFEYLRLLTGNNSKYLSNPGLYADKVIHKTYMDITESGTEAAAATSISLNRDGNKLNFRVDVPFLFFIWDEETRVILFWGTIYKPNPNY